MTPREGHLEKIDKVKKEIEKAKPGPYKCDLLRNLTRLQKELITYDMYRKKNERENNVERMGVK